MYIYDGIATDGYQALGIGYSLDMAWHGIEWDGGRWKEGIYAASTNSPDMP